MYFGSIVMKKKKRKEVGKIFFFTNVHYTTMQCEKQFRLIPVLIYEMSIDVCSFPDHRFCDKYDATTPSPYFANYKKIATCNLITFLGDKINKI